MELVRRLTAETIIVAASCPPPVTGHRCNRETTAHTRTRWGSQPRFHYTVAPARTAHLRRAGGVLRALRARPCAGDTAPERADRVAIAIPRLRSRAAAAAERYGLGQARAEPPGSVLAGALHPLDRDRG